MQAKLIFIIPVLTILVFTVYLYLRGNTVQSFLLFILTFLPLMDLKITMEAWGGFKTFDLIVLYALIFFLKEFITVNLSHRNDYYLFLFFILITIVLFGGLASEFPESTFLRLLKTLPIFIFGRFFIIEILKDGEFHHKAIRGLKISYITALAFLAIQVLVGLKFTFYPGLAPNTIDPVFKIVRYPGIFFDSQGHGQFLAMGSFLFLYIKPGTARKTRIISYVIFALIVIGILLAGSRAAFGGFAIGLIMILFFAAKKYRVHAVALILAGITAVSIISPETGVLSRTKNLSEDYLFRQSIWKEAFDISKKHPWLGIGTGNYQKYIMRHAQDQYLEIEDGEIVYFDQPENGYLKIMVELGFIGFAVAMLFFLSPLFKAFFYYLKHNDAQIILLMAPLVSWMVAFNTVYSIYDNRLLIMVASTIVLLITYHAREKEILENELGSE